MKRIELQKEFMEMSSKKTFAQLQEEKVMQTSMNFDAFELEKADYQRKLRELDRMTEELTDDVRTLEEANLDLKSEKNRLQLQLEEMRTGMRQKLSQYNAELSTPQEKQALAWKAKEELIRTYNDKEQDVNQIVDRKDKLLEDQRRKVRALKRYARELKYQAEDWAPLG